ncbi:unnamed protein product [Bursaphelenchus xylophilus]|uniref:(pine wood nematode) hypothetical protein n=1 Tax=Bursaphelenchus xylophilus TaxID=6326 RepID=A0A1I7RKB9_BURXY|nr:unnamed protein product [Bursaphelenchus xylophilus]CAG9131388.1 unnamed protein product [Bursaphelenchus xylophilus]
MVMRSGYLALPLSLLLLTKCTLSCAATSSSTTPCGTCPSLQVITDNNSLDHGVTLTMGTNSAQCATLTVTCTGDTSTSEVILLWTDNGQDQGSSTDSNDNSVTRTLVCNNNMQWTLTDNDFTGVVTAVECLAT